MLLSVCTFDACSFASLMAALMRAARSKKKKEKIDSEWYSMYRAQNNHTSSVHFDSPYEKDAAAAH